MILANRRNSIIVSVIVILISITVMLIIAEINMIIRLKMAPIVLLPVAWLLRHVKTPLEHARLTGVDRKSGTGTERTARVVQGRAVRAQVRG